MPRTIQRRRTTTRTTDMHSAEEVKSNIRQVASEIARVRDQAREEATALDKIRSMLDMDHLNGLLHTIEEMEERIQDLEDDALQSTTEASRLSEELDQEQDRLQKLWDAYKVQEDELERLKRDYPLMEEKLFDRERSIEGLRREIARLEPLSRFKSEYDAAMAENESLAKDLEASESDLENAQKTIDRLERDVDSLRAFEADSHRVKDLERELEEERERLAKLYRVYEDQESEKAEMQARLTEWEAWLKRVRHSFEETGKAPTMAPIGRDSGRA